MSVGDINSTEKGSGARFNDGKVPLDFVPVEIWWDFWASRLAKVYPQHHKIVEALIDWQQGRGTACRVLQYLPSLADTARVFEFGSKKYAAWNWAKGMAWSVPVGCIMRHFEAIFMGEEIDPESGLPHLGHIGCNLVMLAHYERYYPEGDDRPLSSFFGSEEPQQYESEYDELLAMRQGTWTSEQER